MNDNASKACAHCKKTDAGFNLAIRTNNPERSVIWCDDCYRTHKEIQRKSQEENSKRGML